MRHNISVCTFLCAGLIGLTGWIPAGLSAPMNDDFLAASVITGTSTNVLGSNVDATSEVGEPLHATRSPIVSVWWRWVAPAAGEVTIDTFGSTFDTVLAVHVGSALSNLVEVVGDDDTGGSQSEVFFIAAEGVTYYIVVDGFNMSATGNINLNLVERQPNDNFADPKTLNTFDTGTNVGATPEVGEPNHAGISANASVWWTWTAPSNGNFALTLIDSEFDTVLAVYTGTELTNLTTISSNDDNSGSETFSSVIFAASSGTNYRIAVDSKFPTQPGSIFVTIQPFTGIPPPPNDDFGERATVSGFTTVTGSTVSATVEAGEPQHVVPDAAHASVWWTWTAPTTGNIDMDTFASDFNTQLAVYTGTELTNLTKIASNGDFGAGTQSKVTINVLTGVTYQIAIDGDQITGPENATGTVVLAISQGPAGPLNDHFSNAIALSGLPTNVVGNNVNATFEMDEPNHDHPRVADSSAWWSWTAPTTTIVHIDTFGSSFDTVLAVYTGATMNAFTQIASNNKADTGTDQSRVSFAVQAGIVYHIAVDGHFGSEGNITLNIGEIPNPGVTSFDSAISNSLNFIWISEDKETYEVLYSSNLVSWAVLTNLVSTSATSDITIANPGLDPAFFSVRIML